MSSGYCESRRTTSMSSLDNCSQNCLDGNDCVGFLFTHVNQTCVMMYQGCSNLQSDTNWAYFVKLNPRASCAEWSESGASTNGNYAIDPDGLQGIVQPLVVECNFSTIHITTVIHHNLESEVWLGQTDLPEDSLIEITYDATDDAIAFIIRQVGKVVCLNVVI